MDELQNRIRERAYLLWVEEGRPHGRDEHHWHMAVQFIATEDAAASAGEVAAQPKAPAKKPTVAKKSKVKPVAAEAAPKKPVKTPAPAAQVAAVPETAEPPQAAPKVPSARKRSKTPVATAK
ncbi:DUF2934 domain-containing protein [Ancylobacter pratisalsi]|uniref:DUF2934 domain-containing protein n=1 Tax=Ancylobacter pratisalsi TaxID=1745854 RepID=A0A6P1YK38_9HYPH|nr:DUF2934 domain-containing protein [Ancylobacter pratisalsi]QIB33757.1 DUF2934 domain-containing protein [Ancylobacter pratisalsi]